MDNLNYSYKLKLHGFEKGKGDLLLSPEIQIDIYI